MTDKEKAIVMAYTGVSMLSGEKLNVFYTYIGEIMGREVYTHELGDNDIAETIKERSKADFIALCSDQGLYDDWLDIRSDAMTFEQAKHAVEDLRRKLAFYLIDYPKFCPKCGTKLNIEEGDAK